MSNKVRLMKQQEDLELISASTTYQYHAYHLFDIDNMSQLYLRNLSDAVHPTVRIGRSL